MIELHNDSYPAQMTKSLPGSSLQPVSVVPEKVHPIGLDKFFEDRKDSLRAWTGMNFTIMTKGSSPLQFATWGGGSTSKGRF
ncbi:MAG: hypothetical protein GXP53_03195 [Deltaproteobacteria bacterium]|nr:hypothetical protein [Deltaproteobacteria bacterium]